MLGAKTSPARSSCTPFHQEAVQGYTGNILVYVNYGK